MKKKILLGLVVITSLCLLLTGCGKNKDDDEIKNKMVLHDNRTGYTLTFTFDEKDVDKFVKVKDEQTEGAFAQVEYRNEEKNMSLDMYFFKTSDESYVKGQENRMTSEHYKEYTWNGYEGYSYLLPLYE